MGLTVSLLPRDHSFLFSEHHGLLMLLRCAHASNANLFLENQPPLDNDDFLHDRNDRGVPFLTDGRHDFYGPADRYPFDLDPNPGQLLVDQLFPRPRYQSDLYVGLSNLAPRDRNLFDMKRNPQIFWLPLLIGHTLLS